MMPKPKKIDPTKTEDKCSTIRRNIYFPRPCPEHSRPCLFEASNIPSKKQFLILKRDNSDICKKTPMENGQKRLIANASERSPRSLTIFKLAAKSHSSNFPILEKEIKLNRK